MVLGPRIGNDGGARVPGRPTGDISPVTGQPNRLPGHNKPKRRIVPTFDPYDLPAAFSRLKQLLSRDTDGVPRNDAPRRGYYLNILV